MGRQRSDPPHVAFIVETSVSYGREILHGVARYVRENGPWTVYFEERSRRDPPPPWLRDWDGDGIISRLSPSLARPLLRLGIPTVDLDDRAPGRGWPTVWSDHGAIGALGGEHLLERGFRHFAFFGHARLEWSRLRRVGFLGRVHAAGFAGESYRPARTAAGRPLRGWEEEVDDVARWIGGLPKPLGLMTCNDLRGVQALDACRRAGVTVPEEVAVIGVDNEVLACELAYPPLSSVVPDCRRLGFEAAALLDRLMRGERPEEAGLKVPPLGVVTRQSTDVDAIEDRLVVEAMRIIRRHACEGIRVEEVVDRLDASRSVLQRRFRAVLGRSIHDEIAAFRLRRVRELLVESDLPLEVVAERAGFSHVQYLCTAFRKATGSTPGVYRREHRRRT